MRRPPNEDRLLAGIPYVPEWFEGTAEEYIAHYHHSYHLWRNDPKTREAMTIAAAMLETANVPHDWVLQKPDGTLVPEYGHWGEWFVRSFQTREDAEEYLAGKRTANQKAHMKGAVIRRRWAQVIE